MKKTLFSILVLMLGVFLGIFVNSHFLITSPSTTNKSSNNSTEKKIAYWVAPMDPNFRRDKPGKSPMGMDLVPVYENDQTQEGIKISPTVENNIGVKVVATKRMNLSRVINTVGYVEADENNIEHVHSYTDGWIRKMSVKTTGAVVKKGELLLELYSPTIVNAQEEYLLALKNKNITLINAGYKKLKTLGMQDLQIQMIKKSRIVNRTLKIIAQKGGIVSKLNAREGKFIKPNTDLMTLEDLSQIWIIAEVFENQANWVAKAQTALAKLPYIPNKVWQGKIDYVYPRLDAKTHTLKVRIVFPNPDLTIKPNMYANIEILAQTVKNALAIPREALIRTGSGDSVIVSLGNGKYKSQAVTVGIEADGYYQVLSGLKNKQNIVTSAQFLIDSEANIQAGLNRLSSKPDNERNTSISTNEIVGMGVVESIEPQKHTITLNHEPIQAIDMPAMSMEISVAPNVSLKELHVGEKIHFILEQKSQNDFVISKIHKINQHEHHHH